MSSDKAKNKDITNFHRLCRDLYKYIQRKVIKRYVNPEMTYAEINKQNSLNNIINEKEWKYYNSDGISEEEKILDIFKDNVFLSQIQKCYESLEIVINSLNENQKNIEFLQKNIEVGEHKIQLLSQLNSQLNQFFKSKNENQAQLQSQSQPKNSSSNNNKTNVLERLNLVKSLNILNDLQIFNSINDQKNQDKIINKNNTNSTNTTITNNNNIILDNKIINNNIGEHQSKESADLVQEPVEDINYSSDYINIKKNDWKLLNRKNKRDKKDDDEYEKINNSIEYTKTKNSFIKNNQNFGNKKLNIIKKSNYSYNDINSSINKNGQNFQKFNKNISEEDIDNNNIQHKNSESSTPSKKSEISTDKEDNESKQNNQKQKENENNENCQNKETKPTGDNILEIQFEKVLRQEFSSIYSPNKKFESNKEILREIKIVLKKINTLKFNRANKFDDPYLIGSYSHFDLNNLLDNIPAIDILFKCKDIKSFDELKGIAVETMQKKLCLNYIEIAKDYDKQNEIVKMVNKCKIKSKNDNNNNIFIFINLFFVGINLSSYNKKEQSINRFLFSNNIFDDKGKILICLFFRKLFFIMPEFLDIIINFYFNEKDSLSLTIENIFYDLFNGEMNFNSKKNNKICKDEDNMKDITEFINEWFKNKEYKNMLNNAIISTQESILKNDFYSTFNEEE